MSGLQAVGLATLGFTLWVLSDTCVKLAGETALPPIEILAFFGLFGAGFLLLRAAAGRRAGVLWPSNPSAQAMRACLGVGSSLCNIVALRHLPMASFYVTVFAAPLMIALLATAVLREPLGVTRLVAILAGFAGVVIAVDPAAIGGHGRMDGGAWIGYVAAGLSSVLFAVNVTWLRRMTQSERSDSLAFVNSLMQAVAGFGAMLVLPSAPVSWSLLGLFALMGVLNALGGVALYSALKHTTAATVAPFHYTQIVTGTLIGFAIWHDVPAVHVWLGAGLIIAAGVMVARRAAMARSPRAIDG